MAIIIDSREPEDIQILADIISKLDYGDIKIISGDNIIYLERKTPTDFMSSLISGRLNDELMNCNYLLIDLRKYRFDLERYFAFSPNKEEVVISFINALNTVSTHHPALFALNNEQLKNLLRRFEKKLSDGSLGLFKPFIVKDKLLRVLI
jgi:hypothetical protein